MIRIQLLGSPAVTVDGEPLSGDAAQRRRLVLLAVLATPPVQPRNRDWLVGLLWPEHDSDSARHLLSAAVHVLRKALGDVLHANADSIALAGEQLAIDCVEFREALAAGNAEAAVALYRGPYLESFFIKNSAELEQWIDGQRADYARLYKQALRTVALQRQAAGDHDRAIEAWRALNGADPLDAESVIGLMDALAAQGDRAGALRQAHVHAQLLEQEVGAQPDANVEARAQAIRNSSSRVAHDDAAMSAPPLTQAGKPTSHAAAPRRREWVWLVTAAVIIVAALWVRVLLKGDHNLAASAVAPMYIAVTPFREDPHDTTSTYLARGIPNQIMHQLARVPGIYVVPMTSSDKVADTNAQKIGSALSADYVVTGELQNIHGNVRMWVHITRARDGFLVSVEYNVRTSPEHLYAIQDSIAVLVTAAMSRRLAIPDLPRSVALTSDSTALQDYLHAINALAQRTPDSLQHARDYFRHALARDSTFAPAYAGLAMTYTLLGSYDYGVLEPRIAYDSARIAATLALRYDPASDEAHAALGNVRTNYDWDAAGAEVEFRRALQLNPQNPEARQWYALSLVAHQRKAEALAQMDTARRIDRLNPMVHVNRAHVLYYSGRFDDAARSLDDALKIDPKYNRAHVLYALVDIQRGRVTEALGRLEPMTQASDEPTLNAVMSYALTRAGRTREARAYAARLEAQAVARYVAPELRALAAVGLGQTDPALAHLREALRLRSGGMTYLAVEPLMDALRTDRRYQQLLRQVGLVNL